MWSQSSRFRQLGGDFPATFHVATKILCPHGKENTNKTNCCRETQYILHRREGFTEKIWSKSFHPERKSAYKTMLKKDVPIIVYICNL